MSVAAILKTTAALSLAGLATACGFSPLYADRDTGLQQKLSSIEVSRIESMTDSGYFLQTELQRRINNDAGTNYVLEVKLSQNVAAEAITLQADTVRYRLGLRANYVLLNTDGETLLEQSRSSSVSYGVTPSQYSTKIAEEEAIRNATEELANQIEMDLVIFFRESPAADPLQQ